MKKFFVVLPVLLIAFISIALPCFAVTDSITGSYPNNRAVNILGWDTMYIDQKGVRSFFDNPMFDYGYSSPDDKPSVVDFSFPGSSTSEADLVNFSIVCDSVSFGSQGIASSWHLRGFDFSSSTFFNFGFMGNTPVRCNFPDLYSVAFDTFKIKQPAGAKFTYSVGFDLLVPYKTVADSGAIEYTFSYLKLTYEGAVNPPSASDAWVNLLPRYELLLGSSSVALQDVIIVDSWFDGSLSYDNSMFDSDPVISFQTMQYGYPSFGSGPLDLDGFLDFHKDIVIVNNGDLSAADFLRWLGDSLNAFLSVPLVGAFTFGGILAAFFAIGFVVALIRMFS